MKAKKLRLKKEKKSFVSRLKNVAVLCLMCYALFVLVSQQVTISQKKDDIQKIKAKVEVAQQENDENTHLMSISDTDEYMKRVAIEKLGYAYPGEIRVYDTSKN